VALSFSVIYFYTKPSNNVNQLQLNYSECAFNPETKFNLCFHDSKSDKFFSYGEVSSLYSLKEISYSLKGNEDISYLLNLSSFTLPSSYRICVNGLMLTNSSENKGDADLYQYDPLTNTEFVCVSKLYTTSNHDVSNSGALPCMQGQFPIVEVYIFPASFNGTAITDFKNNINLAEKIFAAYGETTC